MSKLEDTVTVTDLSNVCDVVRDLRLLWRVNMDARIGFQIADLTRFIIPPADQRIAYQGQSQHERFLKLKYGGIHATSAHRGILSMRRGRIVTLVAWGASGCWKPVADRPACRSRDCLWYPS